MLKPGRGGKKAGPPQGKEKRKRESKEHERPFSARLRRSEFYSCNGGKRLDARRKEKRIVAAFEGRGERRRIP